MFPNTFSVKFNAQLVVSNSAYALLARITFFKKLHKVNPVNQYVIGENSPIWGL
jgi:uncharacterized lipoprotein YbaY